MTKWIFFFTLGVFLFSFHAYSSEEEVPRFNLRVNPVLFFIGGNLDLDVILSPNWTIGPSFFGWGGCDNLKPSNIVVSNGETKTNISSGSSTQLLLEASLGYRF